MSDKPVEIHLGYFVLHCIDQRWPAASCLREVRNLFAADDARVGGLEDYVKTMYEIFVKDLP